MAIFNNVKTFSYVSSKIITYLFSTLRNSISYPKQLNYNYSNIQLEFNPNALEPSFSLNKFSLAITSFFDDDLDIVWRIVKRKLLT